MEGGAARAAEAGGGVLGRGAHAVDGVDDLLARGDGLRADVAAADRDLAGRRRGEGGVAGGGVVAAAEEVLRGRGELGR